MTPAPLSPTSPGPVGADRRAVDGPMPWAAVAGILLVAAIVRLAFGWGWPGVVHADETFQYLEQAYRVVAGRGLVPWEYRVGARSWLLPGMLVPVVAAVRAVSTDPMVLRWVLVVLGTALSLAALAAAAAIGARAAGRSGALWTAAIGALWPELVQMAPHVLADSVAAVPLIAGIAVAWRRPPVARRLAAAGLLLALAAVIRPQLAPAVALAAFGLAWRPAWARLLPIALGGGTVLLVYGLVDWFTWGMPFRSLVTYVHVNAVGIADTFGRAPAGAYLAVELASWGWATIPVVATAIAGARRAPLPAAVFLVVFLVFSLIGHKEPRFVYPALPLLFALCGVGTAALVAEMRARRWPIAVAAGTWLSAIALAATTPMMAERREVGSGALRALDAIDRDRAACGVGVVPPANWAETGLSRLRDDVGLYDAAGDPRAFNRLLTLDTPPVRPPLPGYRDPICVSGDRLACVWRRPGGCVAGRSLPAPPGAAVTAILRREGLW